MIVIKKKSMLTGKTHTMELPITLEEYAAWQSGTQLIQSAFPQLTPDQREFLLTGSTPEEWDQVFGEPGVTREEGDWNDSVYEDLENSR